MEAFEYSALPAHVIFGFGTLPRAADELLALGRKRAFVLSDPHHATAGAARLMDAFIFCGGERTVKHVMVGGKWIVRDGRHPDEAAIESRYRQMQKALLA